MNLFRLVQLEPPVIRQTGKTDALPSRKLLIRPVITQSKIFPMSALGRYSHQLNTLKDILIYVSKRSSLEIQM